MKTVGIIAEYNPFHNGHAYQIREVKEHYGADFVVVAMSGDFVQRGAPALLPKHVRAEMALRCGADLVLELPISVSTGSAEFFASGAVSLLDQLHVVDQISFGCENKDSSLLFELASVLASEPPLFQAYLKEELKAGRAFPAARSAAMMNYMAETASSEISEFLSHPNNLLALEYQKALLKRESPITCLPILRQGDAYHEDRLHEGHFASATAIRKLLISLPSYKDANESHGDRQIKDDSASLALHQSFSHLSDTVPAEVFSQLSDTVPIEVFSLLCRSYQDSSFVTEADFDLLLHYTLLRTPREELAQYADLSDALANRIRQNLNRYRSFSSFVELLKTKELTYTRISRALLHLLLGIEKTEHEIPYARVLGFRKDASPLLKQIKGQSSIPLLTKLSDGEKLLSDEARKILQKNTECSNIYESILSHKTRSAFRHEYQKSPIIV